MEIAVASGFRVVAIDAFADEETAACCDQVLTSHIDHLGFEPESLISRLRQMDLCQFCGVVYGSGFEARPQLLGALAAMLPMVGNPPHVVEQVKSSALFEAMRRLQISYPATYFSAPPTTEGMLTKIRGGCGGTHITETAHGMHLSYADCYFQERVDGTSVSILFLATVFGIEVIGFNEQWLSPDVTMPYRYGGAVGHADLSGDVKAQLVSAAEKLASAFGLRGLNSLDAIVQLNEDSKQVLVLEINPRLSASIDLYAEAQQNLFVRHVEACSAFEKAECVRLADVKRAPIVEPMPMSKAHAIVYANRDVQLASDLSWPEWVKDRPLVRGARLLIQSGHPLCTVIAVASQAASAKDLAQHRAQQILALMPS